MERQINTASSITRRKNRDTESTVLNADVDKVSHTLFGSLSELESGIAKLGEATDEALASVVENSTSLEDHSTPDRTQNNVTQNASEYPENSCICEGDEEYICNSAENTYPTQVSLPQPKKTLHNDIPPLAGSEPETSETAPSFLTPEHSEMTSTTDTESTTRINTKKSLFNRLSRFSVTVYSVITLLFISITVFLFQIMKDNGNPDTVPDVPKVVISDITDPSMDASPNTENQTSQLTLSTPSVETPEFAAYNPSLGADMDFSHAGDENSESSPSICPEDEMPVFNHLLAYENNVSVTPPVYGMSQIPPQTEPAKNETENFTPSVEVPLYTPVQNTPVYNPGNTVPNTQYTPSEYDIPEPFVPVVPVPVNNQPESYSNNYATEPCLSYSQNEINSYSEPEKSVATPCGAPTYNTGMSTHTSVIAQDTTPRVLPRKLTPPPSYHAPELAPTSPQIGSQINLGENENPVYTPCEGAIPSSDAAFTGRM